MTALRNNSRLFVWNYCFKDYYVFAQTNVEWECELLGLICSFGCGWVRWESSCWLCSGSVTNCWFSFIVSAHKHKNKNGNYIHC